MHVARAGSWSHFWEALLERMVLQGLVRSSECCINVYEKSGFVSLCFLSLFKPFPRALTLAYSTNKL